MRFGPLRRLEHARGVFGQQPRDLAVRVVDVAEDPDLGRAGLDAGGQAAGVDAVGAEGALVHRPDLLVVVAGVVGAGGLAVFAADAFLGHDVDDAVRVDLGGMGRADVGAGGVG